MQKNSESLPFAFHTHCFSGTSFSAKNVKISKYKKLGQFHFRKSSYEFKIVWKFLY